MQARDARRRQTHERITLIVTLSHVRRRRADLACMHSFHVEASVAINKENPEIKTRVVIEGSGID